MEDDNLSEKDLLESLAFFKGCIKKSMEAMNTFSIRLIRLGHLNLPRELNLKLAAFKLSDYPYLTKSDN